MFIILRDICFACIEYYTTSGVRKWLNLFDQHQRINQKNCNTKQNMKSFNSIQKRSISKMNSKRRKENIFF